MPFPHLILAMVHAIVAEVPNPPPADPTGGAKGVTLLFSYIKWGVLIVCGAVALASAGYMAAGKLSDRPDNVHKGKTAFLWSFGATVAAAIAIPALNTVFAAAS